jgi:hypothetical protein
VVEQKKAITSRAASVSKKEDEFRKKIEEQIKLKEKESSRRKSKQEKSISRLNEALAREKKPKEEVEIIKTKQTIEIVF